MDIKEYDLVGKICPYCIMSVILEVDNMEKGEKIDFILDDPLAIKAIPEELEEYDNVEISIDKIDLGWRITVKKN